MPELRLAVLGIVGLLGLFLMWKALFPDRPETDCPATGNRPHVSVIVPARNEARRIGPLLNSLGQQSVSPREIIVLDDGSSDDTAFLARQCGAVVVQGQALPAGWNGKQWACWQAAQHADGEVLLFLDADTWLETDGLERLLWLYGERGGLLTIQPYHVTCEHYEQFSAFFNVVVIAGVGTFTPFGERIKAGGAFGPCVMCSKEEYLKVEGHAGVRSEVLEDIPLARSFQRAALPVRCHTGRGIISFRMYPGGLREVVEGWSRSTGYGALSVSPVFGVLITLWIVGCFAASFTLVRAATSRSLPALWVGLAAYLLYALEVRWILAGIGRFKWWTWLFFPLPLSFFGLVTAWSLFLMLVLGRVRWKDRTIVTKR